MNKTRKLASSERRTFALIARATLANPFSAEREVLDRQLVGDKVSTGRDELFAQAALRAQEALAGLERSGRVDFRRYGSEDQPAVRIACLFDGYHRFRLAFDTFIQQQIKAGDEPCRLLFARDVLSDLVAFGFHEEEALRYLAIFYQMRRAFYFIEQTLTGISPSIHALRCRLWNSIFTTDIGRYETLLWDRMEDFSTLLLGETGTGKGAAAAAIGRSGFIPFNQHNNCFAESFAKNLITLNLSQFPETLIESELFGHRKGAFTGAMVDYAGALSRCTPHGSIFLDEIGDVSLPVQIKLLQVLQERTFFPVGSHDRQRFNGRVIAATNKPLDEMRGAGLFRDDFYYRLCSDIIEMPPLRQRIQEEPRELMVLVQAVLRRLLGGEGERLDDYICGTLRRTLGPAYPWPGNVRELEQAVRRILVAGHYHGEAPVLARPAGPPLLAGIEAGKLDARQLLAGYCQLLYQRHGTIEEVARCTGLDRRTVKKHLS